MTEKEKMIEAINSVQIYGIMSNAFGGDLPVTNEMLADALIEAGIGDVTEWKERAKKHRVRVLPDGTIKQLYSAEEVEDIDRQREEYKHRAEVAERALRSLAQLCAKGAKYYLQSDKAVKERERELYDEWINNAEKEISEEKKQ